MKQPSNNFSRRSKRPRRRRGLTLIESTLGLAILASLVAAVLVARGRLTRQIAEAERRQEAVVVADELLAGWWADLRSLPRNEDGRVEGEAKLLWRTRVLPHAPTTLETVEQDLEVVCLTILDGRAERQGSPVELVAVEVLVPAPLGDSSESNQPRRRP